MSDYGMMCAMEREGVRCRARAAIGVCDEAIKILDATEAAGQEVIFIAENPNNGARSAVGVTLDASGFKSVKRALHGMARRNRRVIRAVNKASDPEPEAQPDALREPTPAAGDIDLRGTPNTEPDAPEHEVSTELQASVKGEPSSDPEVYIGAEGGGSQIPPQGPQNEDGEPEEENTDDIDCPF